MQIRSADSSHKPTATILAQTTVYDSALTSAYAWTTIGLDPVSNLDPDLGYCIVVQYVSGKGDAIAVEREKNGSPMPADCDYMDYDEKIGAWKAPDDTKDLRFRVRGTVTTGGS